MVQAYDLSNFGGHAVWFGEYFLNACFTVLREHCVWVSIAPLWTLMVRLHKLTESTGSTSGTV